jgi:hypothetical protein
VPSEPSHPDRPKDPARAVGDAIQNLVAVRLGRGFLPLALLFALGMVHLVVGSEDGLVVALGAVLTSGAMLAYGLRTAQRALGRPEKGWMMAATVGGIVPPLYGMYVLAWRGLRAVAVGGTAAAFGVGVLHVALGVWVLRSWMRVVEIERLARVMTWNPDQDGGAR